MSEAYCQYCQKVVKVKEIGAGVGVCGSCGERLILPKQPKKSKKKREKWGSLSDYKQVCHEIWLERKNCEDCNRPIKEPKYHNFHHTKGRTINFLNKNTIKLSCYQCHSDSHGIKESAEWLDF